MDVRSPDVRLIVTMKPSVLPDVTTYEEVDVVTVIHQTLVTHTNNKAKRAERSILDELSKETQNRDLRCQPSRTWTVYK